MSKKLRPGGSVAALSLLVIAGMALPAQAASATPAANFTVSDYDELQDALADCSQSPKTITFAADLDIYNRGTIRVNCDTTFDMGEHNVYGSSLFIAPGKTVIVNGVNGEGYSDSGVLQMSGNQDSQSPGFEITGATLQVNSGRLYANGPAAGSAIGGRTSNAGSNDGGNLIVSGGWVEATGSIYGYGTAIGGGAGHNSALATGGNGGTVSVTSGTLNVITRAEHGVGIGGGGIAYGATRAGDGADISVTGGTLTVTTSGDKATAIGGGAAVEEGTTSGSGGTLTIGAGGTVVIHSANSVFGGGWNTPPSTKGAFGELSISGTLYAESGTLDVADEVTISPTGKLYGSVNNPANGAIVTGSGIISNAGAIALAPPANIVTGNNRVYSFDPSGDTVRVFAPSFAAGYRAMLTPPAGQSWNTGPAATGTWMTADTLLPGAGTTPLYASVPGTISVASQSSALTATAGTTFSYPATVRDHAGEPVVPQPAVTYTSDDCTLPANGVFETVGTCEVTATTVLHGATLTAQFNVNIVAGAPAAVTLNTPPAVVNQGDTITFDLTGTDAFGNPVDTSGAILTSSVPTDIIDGLSVSFPTASPHVITATLGGVSSSVTVQVTPSSSNTPSATPASSDTAGLARTGGDSNAPWVAGALLFLAAGIVIIARKRATAE